MIVSLIGYRGCGKSSVGPLLAARLGCACIDSDDEIERYAGRSIREIFDTDGEAGFRQLETRVLRELVQQSMAVIATGGGAVLAEANRRLLKQAGPVVWLQASADTLAARILGDQLSGQRRPSLTGQPTEQEVADVLNIRLPLYQQAATLVVDTESATPSEITDRIIAQLPDFAAGEDR